MSIRSLGPKGDLAPARKATVFFTGSTALYEGMGVCYDDDRGTATAATIERAQYVELPSVSNNESFAGVAARDYPAKTGGQEIEIFLPGSFCNVRVSVAATIGSHYSCLVGDGDFGKFCYTLGTGSFKALQTADGSSSDTLCFGQLLDGPQCGLTHVVTAAAGALSTTSSGLTITNGAATLGADMTDTLPDGTYIGQRKVYELDGALTTNDFVVSLATSDGGRRFVMNDAIDTAGDGTRVVFDVINDIDGDGDIAILEWNGAIWQELFTSSGLTVSAP